jgi:UrcA family protein
MKKTLVVMAVAAVSLMQIANAKVETVAVTGSAPTSSDGFVVQRATVRYGDLNLAGKQGASALLSRIKQAAAAVCKAGWELETPKIKSERAECRKDAVTAAVDKVDAPELRMVASLK